MITKRHNLACSMIFKAISKTGSLRSCFVCMDIGSSVRLIMQNLQIPNTAETRIIGSFHPAPQTKIAALRLGTLGRATQQVLRERHGRCANFHSYKTLWVMQDVCWNFLKFSILDTHVITTTRGLIANVLRCCSFLLIAKLQQHDPAQEPGLHFAVSPFETVRPSMSELSLFSSCIK